MEDECGVLWVFSERCGVRSRSEKTTEVTHLIQMRERLEKMACLVKANLLKAQWRQKGAYDEKVTVQSV